MYFFDSSALIKRYVVEAGSNLVHKKLLSGAPVFVSALSYSECLRAFARKLRERNIPESEFQRVCDDLAHDWVLSFEVLEVNQQTQSHVREIVSRFPLRASDAVQMSTAIWVRDQFPARSGASKAGPVFAAADKDLLDVARKVGFAIFDPAP